MNFLGTTLQGNLGGGEVTTSNAFAYGPYTAPTNGTLQSLTLNVKVVGSATKVQLALYHGGSSTDPAGAALVAVTGDISTTTGEITGNTLQNPAIVNGDSYWLVLQVDDGTSFQTWKKFAGSGDGRNVRTWGGSALAYGTWASTAPATSSADTNFPRTIYGSFTDAGVITVLPSTLPAGATSNAYNQTVAANGGTGPYTYSVISGTLPTSLSLGSTTGVVSGTPTVAATFNFTIQAADTITPFSTGSQAYTVTIGSLVVSPSSLADSESGLSYAVTFTASGGTGPYTFTKTAGTLPTGASLASNGVLSGTLSASGTFNFTITATDSLLLTGNRPYTQFVNTAVQLNTNLTDPVVNEAYSATLAATGGVGPYTYAVTSGTLPTGLSLASNGVLSGTPSANATFTPTITATDTLGGTGSKVYGMNVFYIFQGSTTNHRVYYQSTAASGVTLANALLATVEADYSQVKSWFGGIATLTPIKVWVVDDPGVGATNDGFQNIFCNSFASITNDKIRFTYTAEIVEIFETQQSKGWVSNWSNGEGLSRVLAAEQYPAQLNADGVDFSSAQFWLNNSRPNWVDTTDPHDNSRLTFGCATCFINWLRWQLGASLTAIVAAASSTLAGTYTILTGYTNGWTLFKAQVDAQISVPTSAFPATDNTFPSVLTMNPASMPKAARYNAYAQTVVASGGTPAYTYAIAAGGLPTGMAFNTGTGVISGVPSVPGLFTVMITATDSLTIVGVRFYGILVPGSSSSGSLGSSRITSSISRSSKKAPIGGGYLS